jgi:hypothetical protein
MNSRDTNNESKTKKKLPWVRLWLALTFAVMLTVAGHALLGALVGAAFTAITIKGRSFFAGVKAERQAHAVAAYLDENGQA